MADNDDDYDYNYEKLILRPLDAVARGQKVSRHTLQTTLMNIISGTHVSSLPTLTYLANYFLTGLKPGTPEIYGHNISGSDSPPSPSGIVLPDIQLPELPMRCVM